MNIEIVEATIHNKTLIERMMELYLHDFSEYEDADLDEEGKFGYQWLDTYWQEQGRYPFLIRVEGKLAGFVLINQHTFLPGNQWSVSEFFILRKYRSKHIGKRVAFNIFDRFHGKWEIGQTLNNFPAQIFWRKVINSYTSGQYSEISLNNDDFLGIVQSFDNTKR